MRNVCISASTRRNILFVLAVILVTYLLFRNSGLYPFIFSDEYTYSKFSRLLPLSESTIPGYIYLVIYRTTNICGDGFLGCARILNLVFFIAASRFVYLVARRFCSSNVSLFVALLTVLGPINSYTAYYMPESLYFLAFWMLAWYVAYLEDSTKLVSWCLAGLLFGLSALVKPHSVLFLPALIAYIFFIRKQQDRDWMSFGARNAVAFLTTALVSKFIVGFSLAGRRGITIFGPVYGDIAHSATSSYQDYARLVLSSIDIMRGHIFAICLLYSLPLAIALHCVATESLSFAEFKRVRRLSFFALTVLINLVFVASLFTAVVVASGGPYESGGRLHMRYYNFSLPLFTIIAASQLVIPKLDEMRRWRAGAALPIAAAAAYAFYTQMAPYMPVLVDSPELRGITVDIAVFFAVSLLSFTCLALWIYSAEAGTKLFVYLFLPAVVITSSYFVNQEMRQRLIPDEYDNAGIFTKQFLMTEDRSRVLIVGSDLARMFRSLFYLDNPGASLTMIPEGASFNLSSIPVGKEWVLVVGDHPLSARAFYQLSLNGFTLARVGGDLNTVDFRKAQWPGVLSRAKGLHSPESWGAWSSSQEVVLEFAIPLPEKFKLSLVAHAFGPNIGEELVVDVGGGTQRLTLRGTPERRFLEFTNPLRSRIMKFNIPQVVSPRSLGLSNDARSLGVGFSELRIDPM